MSSIIIVVFVLVVFFLAYKFYARRLEQLWHIDPKRPTPAYSKYDSVDFIPSRNWIVLFGHHFASISGAGPIIGPVIAVMLWGWLPALLWVILGTIFIGGVHDFGSLIISVREDGRSVADVAGRLISKRAKLIFSLFVWLALILIISVFAYLCADTFVKEPRIVLPSLGLIPIAVLLGYLLYYRKANAFFSTFLSFIGFVLLIYLGNMLIISGNIKIWLLVLFIYAYFASIVPVNILLQPRDYLASFLLFFGLAAGYLGVFIVRPKLTTPLYMGWSSKEGSIWPMLFVIVACGAVSGFHSLVSSGTSSKQLANERHVKKIGYGAMIAESLVAVLAIIATAIIFNRGDNFAGALKEMSPIGIFSKGFSSITKNLLGNYGGFIAFTILNAFILTTLDTATRIARYLTEELFLIKNRYLSTFIIILISSVLAFSGKWGKIWPAFGASNQLVAALALFVVSCWLISKGKRANFILYPAFFMLLTTIGALVFQIRTYFLTKEFLLLFIAGVLIILAIFMTYEVIPLIFTNRRKNE